ARGGLCFASNHASLVDILMLLAYAGRPIGFIAKKELRAIPILGMWIYIIGGLFVDRNSPRKALRTIAEGARRIKAGGAMVIFPEGSRSRGAGLLPFRPGAFKLASQSEATVVPVALCGTYDVFERNRRACACPVTVEFCAPVRVADLPMEARKTALCEMVRETISASLERSERAHSAQSQGGGKG
ncbi:MAG: 1-acyl-sn-glycerol-3-phosphate acyltransferase, partial [Treponema sp.]|nr:1-acyl-sn-glycerol-3-phosphate acyltransferase [Treponema sp.]